MFYHLPAFQLLLELNTIESAMKCYNAVEDKLGSVFERLGHFIARNPWKIITLVIAVNGLLGIGMLNLKTDIDVSRVYTPMNSQAIKDESVVKDIFPDKSGTDFYNHQLVISGKSATVILKPNNGNILDNAFLDECARLDSEVRNITTDKDIITFNDICARRSNSCVVSGDLFLTNAFRMAVTNHNVSFPNFHFATGLVTPYSSLVSVTSVQNGTLKSAAYMKMQYFIRTDTSYFLQSAQVWNQKLVEVLQRFSSDKFDFAFSHTDSLSEELNSNIGGDISLFSVTFTLMIIYACIATYSAKHNCIGKYFNFLMYCVGRYFNHICTRKHICILFGIKKLLICLIYFEMEKVRKNYFF